jgi:hypothetical protein
MRGGLRQEMRRPTDKGEDEFKNDGLHGVQNCEDDQRLHGELGSISPARAASSRQRGRTLTLGTVEIIVKQRGSLVEDRVGHMQRERVQEGLEESRPTSDARNIDAGLLSVELETGHVMSRHFQRKIADFGGFFPSGSIEKPIQIYDYQGPPTSANTYT